MKTLTGSAVLIAATLALSACGGSHKVVTTTDHNPGPVRAGLPAPLLKLIHSLSKDSSVTADRVEVYGPGSRRALVKASSGDLVQKVAAERKGFYLIVLHGHFVAALHPSGAKAPRGTVETQVWSATEGVTDTGISNDLPAAVYRLKGPTLVALGLRTSGPKRGSQIMTFTAPTTTTIANATTGQAMRCTHHGISAGAYVPSPGHGVSGSADGKSASATLNLTRKTDGSLSVSCTP
jgi:hypothetical protein